MSHHVTNMSILDLRVSGAVILALLCAFEVAGNCQEIDMAAFQRADARIVRLAPSQFPQLPLPVRRELERRGCTIPQVWGTKKPGNVIKGSFIVRGETDFAVLCSVKRTTRLLVFRRGDARQVLKVGNWVADLDRLQGAGRIGYSRAISPVGRDYILQHYKAYGGPEPPPIDHQGIDDAFVEKASVVLYFYRGKWLELTGAD